MKKDWIRKAAAILWMSLLPFAGFAQDEPEPAAAEDEAQESEGIATPEEVAEEIEAEPKKQEKPNRKNRFPNRNDSGDSSLVSIMTDAHLTADKAVEEMVTILGSSLVEGEVEREMVTVLGNSRLESKVGREMVTVLGNAYVNGTVGREVVVIMGNLELGPNADVRDITVVGGRVDKDLDAVVSGSYNEVPIYLPFVFDSWDSLHPYIYEGLALGRFVVPSIDWSWMLALGALGVLVLIAAAFPKPSIACVDAMENRPAQSIVSGFAFHLVGTTLISVLALLLIATGIGILAIPFLGMGMLFMWMLSIIAVYGVIGRRFGAKKNIAIATLIGGVSVTLFYAVPFLGVLVFLSISVVGSGAVVVSIFSALSKNGSRSRKSKAARVSQASRKRPEQSIKSSAISDAKSVPAPTEEEGPSVLGLEAEAPVDELPPPDEEALDVNEPVGFGPRFLALLIDFMVVTFGLVAIENFALFGSVDLMDNLLLFWFAYHLIFWMWRSTTLGGVALGLKIERTNGEDLTFGVSLVRSLASIISFVCLGFGFFWASWDEEKQSWHDKIAGTVIVRVPKGVSLI